MKSVKAVFSLSILSIALSGCFGGGGKSSTPAYQAPPMPANHSEYVDDAPPLENQTEDEGNEMFGDSNVQEEAEADEATLSQRLQDHWVTFNEVSASTNFGSAESWKKPLLLGSDGQDVFCKAKLSVEEEQSQGIQYPHMYLYKNQCPYLTPQGDFSVEEKNQGLVLVNAAWHSVETASGFSSNIPNSIIPFSKDKEGNLTFACKGMFDPSRPDLMLGSLVQTSGGYVCVKSLNQTASYQVKYVRGGQWIPSKNYASSTGSQAMTDFTESEYPQGFQKGKTFSADWPDVNDPNFCRNSYGLVSYGANGISYCSRHQGVSGGNLPFEVLTGATWSEPVESEYGFVSDLPDAPALIGGATHGVEQSSVLEGLKKQYSEMNSGSEQVGLDKMGICELVSQNSQDRNYHPLRGVLIKLADGGWRCVPKTSYLSGTMDEPNGLYAKNFEVPVVVDGSPKPASETATASN